MADMIFPTQQSNEGLDKRVNTLNADYIREALAAIQENRSAGKMPAELLEHFKSKHGDKTEKKDDKDDKSKDDDEDDREDKDDKNDEEDNTDPDFLKTALNNMDHIVAGSDEPCVCGSRDCPECSARRKPVAGSRIVRFTDADLTADAIQRDIAAGNTEMAHARLAARQDRRERLASRVASVAAEQVAKSQRLASRSEFRKKVVAEVAASQKINVQASGYKTAEQMNSNERAVIAQRLQSSDEFPVEFIQAALEYETTSRTAEEEAGREILATNISVNSKRIAMRQIVAKMAPEILQRAKDYWKNDLGYGDQEWIDDLFSNKYD